MGTAAAVFPGNGPDSPRPVGIIQLVIWGGAPIDQGLQGLARALPDEGGHWPRLFRSSEGGSDSSQRPEIPWPFYTPHCTVYALT